MTTEQLESLRDDAIQDLCAEITDVIQGVYDSLLEGREAELTAAITLLDAEEQSLRQEYVSIDDAARNLELLLPARERTAQRQADAALLAGKLEKAEAKRQEYEEARHAPEAMKVRQAEITQRIEAIGGERQTIAKRVFASWYADLQHIIRASEHGLFIELLDKAHDEMYAYQERHGLLGTIAQPYSFLVKNSYLENLTADEHSAEWTSGNRWYRGRR